jgi:two-component system, cell cycle response regulator
MSACVLVVDDLAPNVKLLEARLTADYFNVVTASSGPEAIEIVHANPPDIILLDVMMPGMDGFEVCRRLKADPKTCHVPIVLVTALYEIGDRVRGLEAGADDFLTKPVNHVALMARIRSLVRLKMLSDELLQRYSTEQQLGLGEVQEPPIKEAGTGARVLLAETNPATIERVRKALARDDHKIDVVADEAAALAALEHGQYETAVVSLMMANDSGMRMCGAIRSRQSTRGLPLVVLIDSNDTDRLARALDLGVNDYVTRPFDINELVARCRTQIRYHRSQQRLRTAHERNVAMAITDGLTGLHNRRYLSNHLTALIEREARLAKPLAVMMIDIDHFKSVNDTHGHPAGDEVLRAVANRLSCELRGYDTVARWGGEEFAVVLPDANAAVASVVAERLRNAVASNAVAVSAPVGEVKVTVSVGVAVAERGRASGEQLIASADGALYEAKRSGRNRVVMTTHRSDAAAPPASEPPHSLDLRVAG